MGNYRYSWREEDPSIRRVAWIVTLVAQGVLLLLLILFGFVTPLPLPGEEGVAVAFGEELGVANPRQGGVMVESQPRPEHAETPDPEAPLTQDFEEAPSLPTPPKKSQEKPARDRKETAQVVPEQTTAQEQREVQPQRQVDPNALFTGSSTGSTGGETQDGVQKGLYTGTAGGDPEGTGSGTHGTGPSQGRGGKDGISYSLGTRQALKLPTPVYPTEKSGRVVVKVWVDRSGHVVQAEPGDRGTTTFDAQLLEAAKQAALRATFDVDSRAPARQVGTITYVFRLTQKG